MNHHAPNPEHLVLTRRDFLHRCGMGMGALGLAGLLGDLGFINSARAEGISMSPLTPKSPTMFGSRPRANMSSVVLMSFDTARVGAFE